MRAIVLEAPHRAVLAQVRQPPLGPGDVLVRVERAGVCGSDLAVFQGERPAGYPLILGHEAVGQVTDPGDTDHVAGTSVVIEPNIPCGGCVVCRRGQGNVCPSKRSLGMNWPGAFAEYVALPGGFAHPLPADLSLDDAVGIEPLAVALHAFQVSGARAGDRVAVIGCGAEGLLLVQVGAALGAHVLAVDVRPEPLESARRLGAEATHLVSSDSPPWEAAGVPDECASTVFEAAGACTALELAMRVVARGGRVVALGLGAAPVSLVPLDFVRRGLTLIGSLIYDHPHDFLAAIELVQRGRVRPSSLVTRMVELDELPSALAASSSHPTNGKTLVRVG